MLSILKLLIGYIFCSFQLSESFIILVMFKKTTLLKEFPLIPIYYYFLIFSFNKINELFHCRELNAISLTEDGDRGYCCANM